jgi:hypothetical protein
MKRLLVPTILLLAATSVFAQDPERTAVQTRIGKQSATVMGDRGLFTVPSVETLNKGQFGMGIGWSNTDRTPRDLDVSTFPVSFSVGLFSRFMVSAAFEAQKQIKASNLVQPGFNSSMPFVRTRFSKGFGDTYISGKYRLWRQRDNIGGMAVKGFVKVGTGDPEDGLGTGQTDGGADLIFTSQIPWVNILLHSSMGYTATHDGKEPFAVTLKDEVRSGLGIAWPSNGLGAGAATIQGIFEYTTASYVGASSPNAATTDLQNPSDVAAGLRVLLLDSGMTLDAGYRINTKFDRDFPNNRERNGFTFGVSYTKPVRPLGNNRFPVIALETDSIEVARDGSIAIVASGFDADNDPLTYSWTATGGKVEGSGERVTFRATGLAPGKYTVRATAIDGKGGISTSEVEITVR